MIKTRLTLGCDIRAGTNFYNSAVGHSVALYSSMMRVDNCQETYALEGPIEKKLTVESKEGQEVVMDQLYDQACIHRMTFGLGKIGISL